jgi:hypothetical protein
MTAILVHPALQTAVAMNWPSTGASPAHDARRLSSKNGVARDHTSGSFTTSAFSDRVNQVLDKPDSPDPEGTSP